MQMRLITTFVTATTLMMVGPAALGSAHGWDGPVPPVGNAAHPASRFGDWHGAIPISPAMGAPRGVSCASPTFCVSVDGHGYAQQFDGSSWSAPERIDSPLHFGIN